MALVSTISLADARARGFEFWDCALSNWGNRSSPGDPASLVFAVPGIQSVAGLAIAPESLVDECLVRYSTGAPPAPATAATDTGLLVLSKDRPLLFPIPGPIQLLATARTSFYDRFAQINNAVEQPFGPNVINNETGQVWVDPILKVRVFFRTPGSGIAPRAPFEHIQVIGDSAAGGGGESLVKVLPVSGRRRFRVTIRPMDAIFNAMRIAGYLGSIAAANPVTFNKNTEVRVYPAVGTVAVAINNPTTVVFDHELLSWLGIYLTSPAPGASIGSQLEIRAED